MAILPTTPEGQNWMITPAALAVNEPPPARVSDQKFLLVLTGVCSLGLKGNQPHDWRRETAEIIPDYFTPLNHAIAQFGIPVPTIQGRSVSPMLQLDLWAPFAAVSSLWDQGSTDVGVAVDVSPAALARAVGMVCAFRDAQEKQEFPLDIGEHCVRCPFFHGMCPAEAPQKA